jgi:hypothetical protein
VEVTVVLVVIVGGRASGVEEANGGEWASIGWCQMLTLRLRLVRWALGFCWWVVLLLSLHCQMRDERFGLWMVSQESGHSSPVELLAWCWRRFRH